MSSAPAGAWLRRTGRLRGAFFGQSLARLQEARAQRRNELGAGVERLAAQVAGILIDLLVDEVRGELARVTGLSRPDAGLGNRALVKEGYAEMIGPGTYRKLGAIPVLPAKSWAAMGITPHN